MPCLRSGNAPNHGVARRHGLFDRPYAVARWDKQVSGRINVHAWPGDASAILLVAAGLVRTGNGQRPFEERL